ERSIDGHACKCAFLSGVGDDIRRDTLSGHASADGPRRHACIRPELEVVGIKLFQSLPGPDDQDHFRDVCSDLCTETGRSDVVEHRISPFSRPFVPCDQHAAASGAAENEGSPHELWNDEERSRFLTQLFEHVLQLAVGRKGLQRQLCLVHDLLLGRRIGRERRTPSGHEQHNHDHSQRHVRDLWGHCCCSFSTRAPRLSSISPCSSNGALNTPGDSTNAVPLSRYLTFCPAPILRSWICRRKLARVVNTSTSTSSDPNRGTVTRCPDIPLA